MSRISRTNEVLGVRDRGRVVMSRRGQYELPVPGIYKRRPAHS